MCISLAANSALKAKIGSSAAHIHALPNVVFAFADPSLGKVLVLWLYASHTLFEKISQISGGGIACLVYAPLPKISQANYFHTYKFTCFIFGKYSQG
jgi:hypothetical protein